MYKRIVVPVDGSETAQKALVTALQMARESKGCVQLLLRSIRTNEADLH